MRRIVFKTKGLIPIEAFTTFGVNSKPSVQNPIGHFGTGLKYAIAVLVRNRIDVVVYIGRDEYKFFSKAHKFRNKNFDFVTMKASKYQFTGNIFKIREHKLPFTTELGKNWDLWQAFRELHANTLDENGSTFMDSSSEKWVPEDGITSIVVYGEKFVKEYLDRDKNFLPDGLKVRDESTGEIQVIERPSNHIYYRGMRIHDLEKPSQLTYNFLTDVELTEDRTAKAPHMLEYYIRQHLAKSEDEDVVRIALSAPKDTFESRLNYNYDSTPPSRAFKSWSRTSSNPSVSSYVKGHEPKVKLPDPFEHFPRPWSWLDSLTLQDNMGHQVLDFTCADLDPVLKMHILQAINDYKPKEIEYVDLSKPQPTPSVEIDGIPF